MIDGRATQRALVAKGYDLTIDGALGPRTYAALQSAIGGRVLASLRYAPQLGAALTKYLPEAEINTPLRLAHFLAQAACETFGFLRLREIGDPIYFQRYDGRADLGNVQPGDGMRYCGRGLLCTTGRYNYGQLHTITGIDCVNHPELLEQPDAAVWAGVQYWTHAGCNVIADRDDLKAVTKAINGGLNGLGDRAIYLGRAQSVIK